MQTQAYIIVVILSTLVVGGIFAKPATTSQCPSDIPQVYCFVDPCSVSKCPGDPKAKCLSLYCGGCNAIWLGTNGALAQCSTGCKCPPDQVVQCLIDPCKGKTCPAYPDAKCVSNYCGGCNFDWFRPDGTKVKCETSS